MSLWVFGYGSLLFRVDFPYLRREPATIEGWERRLDQGSPDHRGTPERLGRVATLVPAPGMPCGGAAYLVDPAHEVEVLAHLDHRERGGYDRIVTPATLLRTGERIDATMWVASPTNPYHLGPAPIDAMAAQIRGATGPSGANVDYVLALDRVLRELGVEDPHVAAVARALATA